MNDTAIIKKTAKFIEARFRGESSGHDWWHMYRVWQLAKKIAESEPQADQTIVELGALLHDIADWKFHDGDEEAGPLAARSWLESMNVKESTIRAVEEIIRTVSFKGAGVASNMMTIEGQIIHDADKLDAIGAIGIARTFSYGGAKGRAIYDPAIKPELHADFKSYQATTAPTLNHFYEKLLLLKDRMYTTTGKAMAQHRHDYLTAYVDEFLLEWEGQY